MSNDNAIAHGKEKRKPYMGGKAIARSCRNHGLCCRCRDNRLHNYIKGMLRMEQHEQGVSDT